MASYTDAFAVITNFTADSGAWSASSGVAQQTTAGGSYRKLRYNSVMDSTDYYSECIGQSNSSAVGYGPIIRAAASATVSYYSGYAYGNDNCYIEEVTAGTPTTLATGGAINTAVHTMRLEGNGNNLTLYLDGVSTATASDASFSTTSTGVGCYGRLNSTTALYIDNFAAADLAAAASRVAKLATLGVG